MNSAFDKIRRNGCTTYINKEFRNSTFEQLLTSDEKELQERYELPEIPSSEFARLYKFTVNYDGTDREVYLKQHYSRSVLDSIKHLFRNSRAKRAFKATRMLAENGFDVPTVAAMGERRFGPFHTRSFLATFGIMNRKGIYQSVHENLKNLTQEQLSYKRELIRTLGQTIGKMHAKGIFHGDLRLGNILAEYEKNRWQLFFIDNERTKKFHRLPAYLQRKNLVQLNLISPNLVTNADRMRFFKEYCAENGNGKSKSQKNTLIKKIIRKTSRRLRQKSRGGSKLRKCLRTNAGYLRIKTGKYLAMFNRSFCEGAEPLDFIEQIDAMMDKGQILKNDKTSYVSRLIWNGRDIVVKRYNHKGFIHSLRHTIKKSRARRGWLHAHRLRILNIATPRPLAYIEQRKGPLVWKSYLVTEFIEGQNLDRFLRDDNISNQQKTTAIQQVVKQLQMLQKCRLIHGDMKHTNILVTDNGPVLTDLDGMKSYRSNLIYRRRQTQDAARFLEKLEK